MKQNWTDKDRDTIELIISDIEALYEKAFVDDKDIYARELELLNRFNCILRNKPENLGEPIEIVEGQKYECIRTSYYDEGAEMFTKGNVYIALQDKYSRGLGLMSNDGIVRTKRDIPEELNTEYFKVME